MLWGFYNKKVPIIDTLFFPRQTLRTTRASGGIGRRTGFRYQRGQPHEGSSPSPPTKQKTTHPRGFLFSFWDIPLQTVTTVAE